MRKTNRSSCAALLVAAAAVAVAATASSAPAPSGTATTAPSARSSHPGPLAKRGPAAKASAGPKLRAEEEDDARLERYRKWVRDWRARRDIHKKARLKRLRYRLQRALRGQPITADTREEVERHARLMAELNRIKELAVGHSDLHSVGRAEALAREENARHERWLRELQRTHAKGAQRTDAGGDR